MRCHSVNSQAIIFYLAIGIYLYLYDIKKKKKNTLKCVVFLVISNARSCIHAQLKKKQKKQ